WHQKMAETRDSASPESSSAASVFSIVGASRLVAIASISASCAARAASKTGAKSESAMRPNSGRPSGPFQTAKGWFDKSRDAEPEVMKTSRGRVEEGHDVGPPASDRNRASPQPRRNALLHVP